MKGVPPPPTADRGFRPPTADRGFRPPTADRGFRPPTAELRSINQGSVGGVGVGGTPGALS